MKSPSYCVAAVALAKVNARLLETNASQQILCPDSLDGVGEIIRPPFFGVANAVGAAMAKGMSVSC